MAAQLVNPVQVETYLGLGSDRDREQLETVCAAVNDLVSEWKGLDSESEIPERFKFGALMFAARVYRRRNSPAGVESLGELGPVYVSRNDPDLTMMLGLGTYRTPMIG